MLTENGKKELNGCLKFFLSKYSKKDLTYGLIPDTYPTKYSNIASIAGSGFFMCALVIGVEYGLIKKQKAEDICLRSLVTLKNLKTLHGWYCHFYDMKTGERLFGSEYSTIDTCLMVAGALTAGNYFGGECNKIARYILNKCNFQYLTKRYGNRFSMSISYNKDFQGHWDRYAEQLIMYVLASANTNKEHRISTNDIYYAFIRDHGEYNGHKFIYSWHNSLFTHQYSHAFIDFRNTVDRNGTNWFENSVEASLASYEFSCSLANEFKSINSNSWGLTACSVHHGYSGRFGSLPVGDYKVFYDGTMAPCGAIGSVVFTPELSFKAIDYYYNKPELVSDYGLLDAYNEDKNYFAHHVLAIDKGISLVMLANYDKEIIWKYFNNIDIIQKSLEILEIKKENN